MRAPTKIAAGDGALYKTMSTEREVPIYAVSEPDIDNIGRWNTLATIAFALGSAFVSFAAGIWTNFAFTASGSLTAEAKVAGVMVAPAFAFVAAVAFGVGIWAVLSRSHAWSSIKDQSTPR